MGARPRWPWPRTTRCAKRFGIGTARPSACASTWLRKGVTFELVTGTPLGDDDVRIGQAGRGLAHVLPVAVTALTARRAGPGVDVIEHPEAELHPAAHADIAELLFENLSGPARPLIVETHSEMILLRARHWVAEGRLPAGQVLVYWVHAEPGRGSLLEKIGMRDNGEMETWPDGAFTEGYEEILAIRRAARGNAKGSPSVRIVIESAST